MQIVLDTNVLVSGVFWGGSPFRILERWTANKFQVFVTPAILKEYQETLEELDPMPPHETARHWFAFVVQNAHLVCPKHPFKSAATPKMTSFWIAPSPPERNTSLAATKTFSHWSGFNRSKS